MRDDFAKDKLGLIEAQLGPAAYQRPGVLVYHGDCLDLMRRLTGDLFSLTVTSPPYNIGKEYEQPVELTRYLEWGTQWIAEIHRLTNPAGAFWLNLGYLSLPGRAKAIPIPYLLWDRVPFFLVQEIVWNYGAGVAAKASFSPRNEKFLWYVKDPLNYTFNLDEVRDPNVKYPFQKKNGKLKCNPLGKNPTDVWQFPKVTSGANRSAEERTAHPAQFPVAVIDRIVKACSNEGDLLFDPFLGSGTVAEVALRNRRGVVGVEIEKKYVEIASERLDNYFNELALKRSQRSLFSLEERQ
jgi:adenine-specific DNA-methyltransferase